MPGVDRSLQNDPGKGRAQHAPVPLFTRLHNGSPKARELALSFHDRQTPLFDLPLGGELPKGCEPRQIPPGLRERCLLCRN